MIENIDRILPSGRSGDRPRHDLEAFHAKRCPLLTIFRYGCTDLSAVMAGLVPAIHVFRSQARRGWPERSPAMTSRVIHPNWKCAEVSWRKRRTRPAQMVNRLPYG